MPNKIFLPTIEACEGVGLRRFPSAYPSGSTGNNQRQAAADIGVQYSKFGSTKLAQSLQNLQTRPQFNPRDIVVQVLTNRPYKIRTQTINGVTKSTYDYGANNPEPEYEFHISPTSGEGFELDISHNHEWGASGSIFDKILKGAA